MQEQQRQFLILLLITAIGFIGTAMPYPILPPLFLHPMHASIVPSTWSDHARTIALACTLAVYPLGLFFGSPILGSLSDRIGRKPVIAVALLGATLGYIASAIAIKQQSLILLISSRFFTGLVEGNIALARSMVADLDQLDRQRCFGWISSVSSGAFIIGPLFGGFFSDKTLNPYFSFELPFWIAAGVVMLCALITARYLQAPLKPKRRINHHPLQELNIIHRLKRLHQHQGIIRLLAISTLYTIAVDTIYDYSPVFFTAKWQMMPMAVAVMTFILASTLSIGSIMLPKRLSKALGMIRAIQISLITSTVLFLWMYFPQSWQIVLIPYTLLGFTISATSVNTTTLLSQQSHGDIQGEIMGTQLGLRMLCDATICLLAPLSMLFNQGLPFIIGALSTLAALSLVKKSIA